MSVVEDEGADRGDEERPAAPAGAGTVGSGDSRHPLLRALERSELEQPLVFFRDGWDFRWMSGNQVLARLGLGEASRTIVDERGDFEEPPELIEFLTEVEELMLGRTQAPDSAPEIEALAGEMENAFRRRRPSMALPGAETADRRFVLRLGLELGAAFVLPPDPSTFVWTVCTTRPTIVAAGAELLGELAVDLEARPQWRRRRTTSATRFVLELARAADGGGGPSSALCPLMHEKTVMRRIVLRSASGANGSRGSE